MGRDAFLRHKKNSPTIWAERILILRTFDFWIFGVPNLPPIFSWVKKYFQEFSSNFFMGEKYFQESASIFFMGEKYFQEFGPKFMTCHMAELDQNF